MSSRILTSKQIVTKVINKIKQVPLQKQLLINPNNKVHTHPNACEIFK